MLPISAGLPLILSRKKRAQKRRLEPEPARPRGGSALAGSAGRAVTDPALPAHSRSPAAGTTASLASTSGPRPPSLRRARPGGTAADEQRTASRPRPAPLRPTGPRSHPFLAKELVRRRSLRSAAAGPEGRATESSERGLRVRPRHVATPAPSRHPPCVLSEKRLIPMKPKLQEGNNFSLRAAAGWCACEVSWRFSGSRPLTRAATPRGPGRAPWPRARGCQARTGCGPAHSCARADHGRPGTEQCGWLQEH